MIKADKRIDASCKSRLHLTTIFHRVSCILINRLQPLPRAVIPGQLLSTFMELLSTLINLDVVANTYNDQGLGQLRLKASTQFHILEQSGDVTNQGTGISITTGLSPFLDVFLSPNVLVSNVLRLILLQPFLISITTGIVSLNSSSTLDYETRNRYNLDILATVCHQEM